METEQDNRRILVIDDNEAIHDDYRKILERSLDTSLLQEVRAELFDDVEEQKVVEKFEVDCADQGQMGYRMIQEAMKAERPYAVAFVDMRMPPGWDGVETVEHLWQEDPVKGITELFTDRMIYFTKRQVADTDQPVKIISPTGTTTAVGLTANMKAQTLILKQKVRGIHAPY